MRCGSAAPARPVWNQSQSLFPIACASRRTACLSAGDAASEATALKRAVVWSACIASSGLVPQHRWMAVMHPGWVTIVEERQPVTRREYRPEVTMGTAREQTSRGRRGSALSLVVLLPSAAALMQFLPFANKNKMTKAEVPSVSDFADIFTRVTIEGHDITPDQFRPGSGGQRDLRELLKKDTGLMSWPRSHRNAIPSSSRGEVLVERPNPTGHWTATVWWTSRRNRLGASSLSGRRAAV